MNTQRDVTVARPWALAFALALRDALGLSAVETPRSLYNASSRLEGVDEDGWRSLWGLLLRRSATNRGLANLNEIRTVEGLALLDESIQLPASSSVGDIADWAAQWCQWSTEAAGAASRRPSSLIAGMVAAGFQSAVGRRRAKAALGRALPDDLVVGVVPVAGEWGQVTPYGSVLVSEAVAADEALARRWFESDLWAYPLGIALSR